MGVLRLRGVVLPDDEERDLYLDGDRVTYEPVRGARTVLDGGWLLPGLVDAHAHPGSAGNGEPLDEALLRRHGQRQRDAGVALLRCPGAAGRLPRWFGEDPELPRVQDAGPWLAAPGRFYAGWGRQVDLADLPAAAAEEARANRGWCKLVGDWTEKVDGPARYTPSIPPEVLAEAVRRVHAVGARVAVHAQHPDTSAAAVAAGVDTVEHGVGLSADHLDRMAAHGVALTPTVRVLSDIPASAGRRSPSPVRDHMLGAWERHPALVAAAAEAGVTLLAGTDTPAVHGRVAEEIRWLARVGVPAPVALAAGSWGARGFLGLPGLSEGAPADLVAYDRDPREDLDVLDAPVRIVLRGRVVA